MFSNKTGAALNADVTAKYDEAMPGGSLAQEPAATATKVSRREAASTLIGVQILRGIAALMVVFHHYLGTSVERGFAFMGLAGTAIGNVGVDIFFVISGFIMEYTAGNKAYKPGDRKTFMLRRMTRILPLYWAITIFAFCIALALKGNISSQPSFQQFLMSMLVLPAYDQSGHFGYVVTMAWTLTYEFYFYIVFALLLPLAPQKRLLALAAVFGVIVFAGMPFHGMSPMLDVFTNPLVFEFLAGCLLAQLYRKGIRLSVATSALLCIAAAATLLSIAKLEILESWTRVALWGIPAALIVYATVLSRLSLPENGRGFISSAFEHIGNISYSLYLSHFIAISIFVRLYAMAADKITIHPWMAALGLFMLCIVIAQVCYLAIEKPSRTMLHSRPPKQRS